MEIKIKLGVYQHFKGNKYRVLSVVKHSETLEQLVVYQALYRENEFWARPIVNFLEKVKIGDKEVLRFKYIGE